MSSFSQAVRPSTPPQSSTGEKDIKHFDLWILFPSEHSDELKEYAEMINVIADSLVFIRRSYRSISVNWNCCIMYSQFIRAFQLCLWCVWLHMCMWEVVLNDGPLTQRHVKNNQVSSVCTNVFPSIGTYCAHCTDPLSAAEYRPQHSAHKVLPHHYAQPLTFNHTFYC